MTHTSPVAQFAKATALWMFAMVVLAASGFHSARAAQGVTDIAMSAAQKQQVVAFLKNRIARHSKMTAAQIIADLQASAERNHAVLAAQGLDTVAFDKISARVIDEFKMMGDKDAILAVEKSELQKMMSSTNYMFALTHMVWSQAYCHKVAAENCGVFNPNAPASSGTLAVFVSLLSIPVDIVFLPFEFIATSLTGF